MWRSAAGLFAVTVGSLAALGVVAEQAAACQSGKHIGCLPLEIVTVALVALLLGTGLLARYGGRTDR